jgi:hypothetical protein
MATVFALTLFVVHPVHALQSTTCRSEAYLHEQYYEGLPYVAARQAGTRCWQEFVRVLRDTTARAQWLNAIVAIGASAAAGAEQELGSFVRSQSGRLPPAACRAVNAVPVALAYHANQSSSASHRALAILGRWALAQDSIRWYCDYDRSPTDAQSQLAVLALLSLGLSGRAGADSIIDQVGRTALRDTSLIREARRIQERVATIGLEGYYAEERARRADRTRPGRRTP